jgi:hypothetical protein
MQSFALPCCHRQSLLSCQPPMLEVMTAPMPATIDGASDSGEVAAPKLSGTSANIVVIQVAKIVNIPNIAHGNAMRRYMRFS